MKNIIRRVVSKLNIMRLRILMVDVGHNCNIRGRLLIKNKSKGNITIGNNVVINSGIRYNPIGFQGLTSLYIIDKGSIEIGSNVGISNASIVSQESVKIGDYVMIGGGVKIYDTDFHSLNYDIRVSDNDNNVKTSPVIIKKGAFIGAGSIILKGVTIGEKSVIGAASVVTKNVPDNEVWAGNPAKFIKKCDGRN